MTDQFIKEKRGDYMRAEQIEGELPQILARLVEQRKRMNAVMQDLPAAIQDAMVRRAMPGTNSTQIERIRAETMLMRKLLKDIKAILPTMDEAIAALGMIV